MNKSELPRIGRSMEEMSLLELDKQIEELSVRVNEFIKRLAEANDLLIKKSIELQLEQIINKRAEYMMRRQELLPKPLRDV